MIKWLLTFFPFSFAKKLDPWKEPDYSHIEPVTLTLDGVKAKAKEYYDKGLLGAQMKQGAYCANFYDEDPNIRCAVSCSYPDRFNIPDLKGAGVFKMEDYGLVKFESQADRSAIRQIQVTHDLWASQVNFCHEEAVKNSEKEFLALVS